MEGVKWRTVKTWDRDAMEQCEYIEAVAAAVDGIPARFIDWNTGNQTFHRADRSTSGRTVKRGPRTIWLRSARANLVKTHDPRTGNRMER